MNIAKTENDLDCRAISQSFLEKFNKDYKPNPRRKSDVCLYPFVELVKKHPELQFCLRGNSMKDEKACIYVFNHAMLWIYPRRIAINPNHLRYSADFEKKLKNLIQKYNFSKGVIPQLPEPSKNNKSCSYKNSKIYAKINDELLSNLDVLYKDLSDVFEDYFDHNKSEDQFLKSKGISLHNKSFQLEKKRQQQLYSYFKNDNNYDGYKNSYLFYDMEFHQKYASKVERSKDADNNLNNQPDMQAIRFDENGIPAAWVVVEVKCTEKAYDDCVSGLSKHIKKMKNYLSDKNRSLIRKREAFLLINQYKELGLLDDYAGNHIEDVFSAMDEEILLVFSDSAIKKWENDNQSDIMEIKKNSHEKYIKIKTYDNENLELLLVRV